MHEQAGKLFNVLISEDGAFIHIKVSECMLHCPINM